MSAAERFKKKVKGNAPHVTKKREKKREISIGPLAPFNQDTFSSRNFYARSPTSYEKRKSGRNETNPRTRKIGFKLNFD